MQSTAHKLYPLAPRPPAPAAWEARVAPLTFGPGQFCTFKTWHEPLAIPNWPLMPASLPPSPASLNTWVVHVCVWVCVWSDHTFNLARQFPALTAVFLILFASLPLSFSPSFILLLHELVGGLTIRSRVDSTISPEPDAARNSCCFCYCSCCCC